MSRPDPAELHAVALRAEQATTDLARVVGSAVETGIIVDDEVYQAVALLTSWSAWLRGLAISKQLTARTPGRDSS